MSLRIAALAAALAAAACAHAPGDAAMPSRTGEAPLVPAAVLSTSGFEGEASIAGGTYDGFAEGASEVWPWASVTKQVLAVMVMQAVSDGNLALDGSASAYLPAMLGPMQSPTVRQLLQHRSGLRNSDDSPEGADGRPDFYTDGPTGLPWCLEEREAPPTEGWRYNNCDYIVLGAILETVSGMPLADLFRERIARPAGLVDTRFLTPGEMRNFAGYDAGYAATLPRYGAAGALAGPLSDMLRFDRALAEGVLIDDQSRAQLWDGDPALGFMALGQWVFEAPLAGCDAPVRIVERRGGIGKYQVRNVILPERAIHLALVTADGEFDFGEIWTGSGVMHDFLAAAACG